MQVTISGKQIDIGTALQKHVNEHLEISVKKYFDRAVKANVVFSKESHLVKVDISVNEGTKRGIVINATGEGNDAYSAFDKSLARIEKQLRRYKRKIKNHHKNSLSDMPLEKTELLSGTQYVIEFDAEAEVVEEETAPLVIAENNTNINTLTVSEAVMHMDLSDVPALMFINRSNGNMNVIYRREDGNISWVDPRTDS